MKDIHIFIKKDHSVDFEDGYAGLNKENLQGNIIFDFEEFVSGQARVEVIIDNEKGYIELERVGQTYTLPIKSSLLSGNDIVMQLVITQEAIDEEIPIWKSESFLLKVGYSINAEAPIPEEYPSWIEIISSLVAETDNAIERAGNLNIEATQTSGGATITITNQDDEQTSVVILNGIDGKDGKDGKDATTNYNDLENKPSINGVELSGNKTTSQLGINIPTVNDATLTIQKNGTNVQTFTANSSTNKTANIIVPTKVSELSNDSGFTNNVGTITGITMNGSSKGTSGVVNLGTVITDVSNKQDTLVSGTNIKTINNTSLLGSGNIDIQGGGGSATDVQINGTSITNGGVANILTKTAYNSSTNKIATESDIPSVSGFITNTDYATSSTGGVFKTNSGYGTNMYSGYLIGATRTYQQYDSGASEAVICKGTLENVITGKGLVSNTDYATQSSTGVIKASTNYQTNTTNTGELYAVVKPYSDYSGMWTNAFISKGTLDNVITGKGLATTSDISSYHDSTKLDTSKVVSATSTTSGEVYDVVYINTMLGDIETLLSEV